MFISSRNHDSASVAWHHWGQAEAAVGQVPPSADVTVPMVLNGWVGQYSKVYIQNADANTYLEMCIRDRPKGSKSAVVYALNATTKVKDERGNLVDFGRLVCSTVFSEVVGDYDEWALFDEAYRLRGEYRGLIGPAGEQLIIDFGANPGEPLAVTVNRKCPDPVTPNAFINAAYTLSLIHISPPASRRRWRPWALGRS